MTNLYDRARQFRAELLARDQAAANDLLQAYGAAWERIRKRLDQLTNQIEAAEQAGETISPAWLFQRGRLQSLLEQVEEEIGRFARYADQRIRTEQAAVVPLAQSHAAELVSASLATEAGSTPTAAQVAAVFNRLPREAVRDLIGFTSAGSPLRSLLDGLGPDASESVRKALITGVATGQNPKRIASQIREELGGNLARAQTIARTEVLRAYRESTRRSYAENSDVVQGWVWVAALGARSCAACIGMHGTVHQVSERLDGHPNCRCVMVPQTSTRREIESGEEWLKRQTAAVQESVLGKAGAAAWREGELTLSDFVGRSDHPEWGTMRYARSLKGAKAAHERRAAPMANPGPPISGGTSGSGWNVSSRLTGQPAGQRVGSSLIIPGDPSYDEVRRVVAAIERVHGLGTVSPPPCQVFRDATLRPLGAFLEDPSGIRDRIRLRGTPADDLAFAHEYGHLLDFRALGDPGSWATARMHPDLTDLWDAIRKSTAYQQAQAYANQRTQQVGPPAADGSPTLVSAQSLLYTVRPKEALARAYSQYVALRSNDPELQRKIDVLRNGAIGLLQQTSYWTDADFETIAWAFDDLVMRKGWRR